MALSTENRAPIGRNIDQKSSNPSKLSPPVSIIGLRDWRDMAKNHTNIVATWVR